MKHPTTPYVIAALLLISLLLLCTWSPIQGKPPAQNPTEIQQTVDFLVNQRFTQTAQAQGIQLTVDAAVQQTMSASNQATSTPTAVIADVSYTAYADAAQKSRISRTLSSPGWRPESQPANPNAHPRSNVAYWTKPGPGTDWIRWNFTPSITGVYQVSVYIPSLRNSPALNTRSAHYQIFYAGGGASAYVDQNSNIGREIALGSYVFNASAEYSVFLDDRTGESGNIAIAADTITWTLVAEQSGAVVQPDVQTTPTRRVPQGTVGIAKDNARIWSAPNVKTGKILRTLPVGVEVMIVSGPVTGPIRYDSDIQGDWYQVTFSFDEAPLGWIWADRLTIRFN